MFLRYRINASRIARRLHPIRTALLESILQAALSESVEDSEVSTQGASL